MYEGTDHDVEKALHTTSLVSNTHGSNLTGVGSVIKGRTGGVMSELPGNTMDTDFFRTLSGKSSKPNTRK